MAMGAFRYTASASMAGGQELLVKPIIWPKFIQYIVVVSLHPVYVS